MSWSTSSGWETMATWLVETSTVVAPMRGANTRWASGGITWSPSAIAALGASGFEAEFDAGKRLRRDAAIGTALGEPAQVVDATPDDASVAPLAKREADVARLVAEGLSNKQIGARLFISERTVDSHVRSILNKLGFSSRAQIAGWMASSNQ